MVTLSLPCFSSIFLSATTRVSTFKPPTLLESMGDLFALPGSCAAGVANSSGIMKLSSVGGLGASRMFERGVTKRRRVEGCMNIREEERDIEREEEREREKCRDG